MRIVKVRRRSTAHYQRMRLPTGADWTAKLPKFEADGTPAEGHEGKRHLARIYNRQEQLDTIKVDWMQRTLESVSLSAEDWRLDRLPRSVSSAVARVPALNDHQLRQLARDQQIRERRRGRHPRLQQQQQHQQALKLAVNTPEAQTSPDDAASPLSVRGMLNGAGGATRRTPPPPAALLDKRRRQALLPPLLVQHQQQLPPRGIVAARDQQLQQQYQLQHQQHQHQLQSLPRQRLRRQQPRRLGGHQSDRVMAGDTAASSAADLQYVSIVGPVARHLSVRWPTPVMEDQQQLQQQQPASSASGDGDLARQLALNSEVTIFQPRNPVNSPEPD